MAVAPRDDQLQQRASDEIGYVLDAARGSLDHQFAVAERLDAKARGQMTLAGAWFTVVQGVAGIVLGGGQLSTLWTAAVLASAAVAAGVLVWAFTMHYRVWKLREQTDFLPSTIEAFRRDVDDEQIDAPGTLLRHYEELLKKRQAANRLRGNAFEEAVVSWFAALGFTLLELLVAVAAAVV